MFSRSKLYFYILRLPETNPGGRSHPRPQPYLGQRLAAALKGECSNQELFPNPYRSACHMSCVITQHDIHPLYYFINVKYMISCKMHTPPRIV